MNTLTTMFGSLLLIGSITAGIETAMACGKGKLILEDKFETLDPAWGFPKSATNRSNGRDGLVYKLNPSNEVDMLNQSEFYNDYEVCAVFATKVPDDTSDAWAGVTFWASDMDNGYVADIFPAWGRYDVLRLQNGKLLKPVPTTSSDAIHKGTDVTNELSVVVKGNRATFAINGQKLIDFVGRPPEGGSLFGFAFAAHKNDKGPSLIILKSIQVREVEAAPKQSQ
jgi:hypothetical protein